MSFFKEALQTIGKDDFIRRVLSLLLCLVMIPGLFVPGTATAAEAYDLRREELFYAGSAGFDTAWSFNPETGVLTISGVGTTGDFNNGEGWTDLPWSHHVNDITTVVVEEGITRLGKGLLAFAENCTSVFLPSTLREIGTNCFYYNAVSYIELPPGLVSLEDKAFHFCYNLSTVCLPASVTEIGQEAFTRTNLYGISVDPANPAFCNDERGILYNKNKSALLRGHKGLAGKLSIPEGVTHIGSYAFDGCEDITAVDVPSTLCSVDIGGFRGCLGLTSISFPEGFTALGDDAFSGCFDLQEVYLPATLKTIGARAFYCCSQLRSCAIAEGVTSLGEEAFYCCSSLTEMIFPNGELTAIAEGCFIGCESLQTVEIPANIRSIGAKAFQGCLGLVHLRIAQDNPYLHMDAYGAIYQLDPMILVYYPPMRQGAYAVAQGTAAIGPSAFYSCMGLTGVELPDTLSRIEANAFAYCTDLGQFPMPAGLQFIGQGAFRCCERLCFSDLPQGVERIETEAFYGCDSLEAVSLPAYRLRYLGPGAFAECDHLTTVFLPKGLTSIEQGTFRGCGRLESVYRGACIETVGDYAFADCSMLTTAPFPKSLRRIGEYAFANTRMNRVDLYEDVSFVACTAFAGCKELRFIRVSTDNPIYRNDEKGILYTKNFDTLVCCPSTVEGSIRVNENTAVIADHAFDDCTALTVVTLPEGVKTVGKGAFYNCSALEQVQLPSTLEEIGDYAFAHCGMYAIVIPAKVHYIGSMAFDNCSKLGEISFDG
ncbi:MAG: leucine-rich repeat domain-containing protein, partial [Oscillospiraceae bacterium]|nr:leucine-rich repeat domain-containing protein [Oscillospiraceae bacterium]